MATEESVTSMWRFSPALASDAPLSLRTVPASVAFYWSNSNTIVPTAGAQPCVQWSNAGHNLWVQYINAPGTAGNYFLWAVAKDSGGAVVATYVWPSAFTVHI